MNFAMTRIRKPYLCHEKTRHGGMVWYVRKDKKSARIRIKGEYGSEQFNREYDLAIQGLPIDRSPHKVRTGSLEWLAQQWQKSSDWHQTAEATKSQRINILDRVIANSGNPPFGAITEASIVKGREDRMATPAAANNFLKTMRGLFSWAKEAGHVQINPTLQVKMLSQATEGFAPWSVGDVLAFRERWALGTRQRLAMELLLWTGLRRGDAVRLGRQHIRNGVAYLKAEKTGADLAFPILPVLQDAIDAGPTGDLAFIVTNSGRPMPKESFGTWFREACNQAKVTGSAHGLRKLSATMAAESGASELQLQSFYGWKNATQSQTYTRKANAEKLSIQLGEKLSGNILSPHLKSGKGK